MLELAKPYEEQGAVFSFDINTGYPAVMNDAALVDQVRKLDPNIVLLEKPEMISEDFAHYQRKVPAYSSFWGQVPGLPCMPTILTSMKRYWKQELGNTAS